MNTMKNIAVIGSGTMGNGIAHTFAQFGYQVNLIDVNLDALGRAIVTITKNLDRQIAKGTITEEEKQRVLNHITTITDLQTGVAEADLIVEAATENTDLKLKIFKDLDQFAKPTAILAS
jgi:3-hydroxybutyryl-CoA dehydrogenase